jgi:uncharacterized membrane protein
VDAHVAQWLQLVVRWAHVITGISWIGTSFYFNWLNSRIHAPAAPEPGASGELWSVHGGGFYRVVKYAVAPPRLPETLHWFKWEAYATWWTGFSLLWIVYYAGARTYLVDPEVSPIAPVPAIGIGLVTLLGAWLAYDALCRSSLGSRSSVLGAVLAALVIALAFGLTRVFGARGAFLHVGAALGTVMAANVWRVIIPSQREMVAAMAAGREPEAARGRQAALRSLHNNYFTLPVVFTMIGGHSPVVYAGPWSWAVLAGLFAAGVTTRHWFNLRNQGRRGRWLLPAAGALLVVLAVATAPAAPDGGARAEERALFAAARVVIAERCAPCHSSAPTLPGTAGVPAGAVFDTPAQMRAWAPRIRERAVIAKTMPLGNVTGMTEEEREVLGRWIDAGARLR